MCHNYINWLIEHRDPSAIDHMFSQWNYSSGVLEKLKMNDYLYNR